MKSVDLPVTYVEFYKECAPMNSYTNVADFQAYMMQ